MLDAFLDREQIAAVLSMASGLQIEPSSFRSLEVPLGCAEHPHRIAGCGFEGYATATDRHYEVDVQLQPRDDYRLLECNHRVDAGCDRALVVDDALRGLVYLVQHPDEGHLTANTRCLLLRD